MKISKEFITFVLSLAAKKNFKKHFSFSTHEKKAFTDILIYGRSEYLFQGIKNQHVFNPKQQSILRRNYKLRLFKRNLIIEDFKKTSKQLAEKNIFFIPLKGIHLNMLQEDQIRNLRDIDLLVRKKDISLVIKSLKEIGFSFKNKDYVFNSDHLEDDYSYDINPMFNKHGTCIEIHYKIFRKTDCKISESMFKTSKKFIYENQQFFLPCLEDLASHLIFHATTKQGLDNGIQIVIDLVNIFEMRDFDINKLMNISVKYNIREELEIFLIILKENKLIKDYQDLELSKKYNFDKRFIKRFTKLLLFNQSTNSSLKLLSKDNLSHMRRVFINSKLMKNNESKKFAWRNLLIFFEKLRIFLPIYSSYIFNSRFRNDNIHVLEILNIIKSEKKKNPNSRGPIKKF